MTAADVTPPSSLLMMSFAISSPPFSPLPLHAAAFFADAAVHFADAAELPLSPLLMLPPLIYDAVMLYDTSPRHAFHTFAFALLPDAAPLSRRFHLLPRVRGATRARWHVTFSERC